MNSKVQVQENHYNFQKYVDKKRIYSLFYQLNVIHKLNPSSIIEIGPGNSFLKNNLPKSNKYFSVDIDSRLKPDIICDVNNLGIRDNQFDMVACFQVLEHLPYEQLENILSEFKRISKRYIFISVPHANHQFSLQCNFPRIGTKILNLMIPKFYRTHQFDGEHYWELGKKGYSMRRLESSLRKFFHVIEIFRPYENNYHVFFILENK